MNTETEKTLLTTENYFLAVIAKSLNVNGYLNTENTEFSAPIYDANSLKWVIKKLVCGQFNIKLDNLKFNTGTLLAMLISQGKVINNTIDFNFLELEKGFYIGLDDRMVLVSSSDTILGALEETGYRFNESDIQESEFDNIINIKNPYVAGAITLVRVSDENTLNNEGGDKNTSVTGHYNPLLNPTNNEGNNQLSDDGSNNINMESDTLVDNNTPAAQGIATEINTRMGEVAKETPASDLAENVEDDKQQTANNFKNKNKKK